jgi:hypothetical protein
MDGEPQMNITAIKDIEDLIWETYGETLTAAGPLPERIEDAPAHVAKHCRLMRSRLDFLLGFSDADITAIVSRYPDDGE